MADTSMDDSAHVNAHPVTGITLANHVGRFIGDGQESKHPSLLKTNCFPETACATLTLLTQK